jgi:hypothetical protein
MRSPRANAPSTLTRGPRANAPAQEPAPEEFFTPYVWSIVYERAGIGWNGERVVLFALGRPPQDGEREAAASDASLPALSSIDVDEGGTAAPA